MTCIWPYLVANSRHWHKAELATYVTEELLSLPSMMMLCLPFFWITFSCLNCKYKDTYDGHITSPSLVNSNKTKYVTTESYVTLSREFSDSKESTISFQGSYHHCSLCCFPAQEWEDNVNQMMCFVYTVYSPRASQFAHRKKSSLSRCLNGHV